MFEKVARPLRNRRAVYVAGGVEQLLGVFLKDNVAYLPFTALTQMVLPAGTPDAHISPARGALVFSGYLVVGWVIGWTLFVRRDAN